MIRIVRAPLHRKRVSEIHHRGTRLMSQIKGIFVLELPKDLGLEQQPLLPEGKTLNVTRASSGIPALILPTFALCICANSHAPSDFTIRSTSLNSATLDRMRNEAHPQGRDAGAQKLG
jgi:hypothetical protein